MLGYQLRPREATTGWRDSAVWSGLRTFRMKLVTTFYRRLVVIVRSLDDLPDLRRSGLGRSARIAPLEPENAPAYERLRPDQRAGTATARMSAGHTCIGVWEGDRLMHAAWVAVSRCYIPYLRCDLILEPGDILVYDTFTDPAARHRGYAHARSMFTLRLFRDSGYRRSVGIVAVENTAGWASARSAGYLVIGMYSCMRLGPWQHCWSRAMSADSLPHVAPGTPFVGGPGMNVR